MGIVVGVDVGAAVIVTVVENRLLVSSDSTTTLLESRLKVRVLAPIVENVKLYEEMQVPFGANTVDPEQVLPAPILLEPPD